MWSLEGPVPTVGVLPALISQSKSSCWDCRQEQRSNSKLQRPLKPSERQKSRFPPRPSDYLEIDAGGQRADGGGLTADVVVLVRLVPAVVDEVAQVVLRDAVAVGAGVLLRRAGLAGGKGVGAVGETHIVDHQVAHVADPSLRPERHLGTDKRRVQISCCFSATPVPDVVGQGGLSEASWEKKRGP